MNKKAISFFVSGLLVGILVATFGFAMFVRQGALGGRRAKILKLAHSLDQNHPVHLSMVFMADRLKEKTFGAVEIEIFPNGQLGSETACIEQVQSGALAMCKTSSAPIESFVPDMAIFGIPYVFRDGDHFWDVALGDIGKQLLVDGESLGLHGLCYLDAGARSFYTAETPILKPSDLKGLKLRVQKSKTSMDMVHALGGAPTPIAWGELYTALSQSMVDGAENNPPSFYTNRHYEVCKHYSLDEHSRVPDILLMSQSIWTDLPEEHRKALKEAADEASEYQRELWAKSAIETLELIKKEGVTIHYPNKSLFADKVAAMHASYAGTSIGKLIRSIKEME